MLNDSYLIKWNKQKNKLIKNHIYNELDEHSSCGVGLIASSKGINSREVVQ